MRNTAGLCACGRFMSPPGRGRNEWRGDSLLSSSPTSPSARPGSATREPHRAVAWPVGFMGRCEQRKARGRTVHVTNACYPATQPRGREPGDPLHVAPRVEFYLRNVTKDPCWHMQDALQPPCISDLGRQTHRPLCLEGLRLQFGSCNSGNSAGRAKESRNPIALGCSQNPSFHQTTPFPRGEPSPAFHPRLCDAQTPPQPGKPRPGLRLS